MAVPHASSLWLLISGPQSRVMRLEAAKARILRRRRLVERFTQFLPRLSLALVFAGYMYLLVIPLGPLSRRTYMSENAIQPAQVHTYWSWSEVQDADRLAEDVVTWDDLPTSECAVGKFTKGAEENLNVAHFRRATKVQGVFAKHGLRSSTQSYSFRMGLTNKTIVGTNTYAILHAAKTDGAEAMVVCASRRSRYNGQLNTRGIAALLSLSKYLSNLPVWSKDIIFVISDGFLDGMQAWINAYHDETQANLVSEPLRLRTGPIWAALEVDYPHHSFSHLGIYYEAANGLLPNLDLINTAIHVSRWAGGSAVRLHDVEDDLRSNLFGGGILDANALKQYQQAAVNVARQMRSQASGSPEGPVGVFAKYRIDGVALFAVPAEGPHGFYSIGKTVESALRSVNNLLERFHQSFFLYLLTSPDTFISVANYIAAPLLVSLGLTLEGLDLWLSFGRASPTLSKRPSRPIAHAIGLIACTHLLAALYFALWVTLLPHLATKPVWWCTTAISVPTFSFMAARATTPRAGLAEIMQSLCMFLSGCALAVVATLNFSIGVLASLCLGAPLLTIRRLPRAFSLLILCLATPTVLAFLTGVDVERLVVEWHLLGTWACLYSYVDFCQNNRVRDGEMSLKALHTSLQSAVRQHDAADLSGVKRELLRQGVLVPGARDGQTTPTQDLQLAAEIIEFSALLSVRALQIEQFESYLALLAAYEDLPPSTMRAKLVALYLLLLLSRNQIGAYHLHLERLTASQPVLMDSPEIEYVVEMERCLMEGSYSKVWQRRQNPPMAEFKPFLDNLMTTIRNEIASCGEKAYTVLPIADAATLLFFDKMEDLMQFAQQRPRWSVSPTSQTISFGGAATEVETGGSGSIDKTLIMQNALGYAKELEMIV